ncbi:hypothetical protein BDV19DRAFT_388279 [Aspergillus venezuelensis]
MPISPPVPSPYQTHHLHSKIPVPAPPPSTPKNLSKITTEITRAGFISSHGNFTTASNQIPRLDSAHLKELFDSKMHHDGQEALRLDDTDNLIKAQLLHYGIPFNENMTRRNRTLFWNEDMHREWLDKTSIEELEINLDMHLEFVLDKFFLSESGSHIVDCGDIESEWPGSAEDMTLDFGSTEEPGIFQASFDFGVLRGVMLISADEDLLEGYCDRADYDGRHVFSEGDDDDLDDEDESEDEDEKEHQRPQSGSKRKTPATPQHSRGRPKKATKTKSNLLKYFLKSRSRETGEGQIFPDPEDGTPKIKDGNLTSFTGEASLPCAGSSVSLTARIISGDPSGWAEECGDYSNQAAEEACVSWWH